MVIIIPTSQKLLAQAQRLARHHEEKDSLKVRIVPADELFNEFSSGTPDVSAYKRYMKYCTNKPILFRSAWGVIRNALANEDHDNYNSVDDVLAKVRKEITLDIQEANKDPITKHITPLLREALDQLDLYRDHVRVKLLYNPMLSDTYSRQRVYRILNI